MVTRETAVKCLFCGSENITRQGRQNRKQTYRCENSGCPKKYFTEPYTNKGCDPDVRRQILVMAANGNRTRVTAKTPGISPNTVTAVLKEQESQIWQVDYNYVQGHLGDTLETDIVSHGQVDVREAEILCQRKWHRSITMPPCSVAYSTIS